MATGCVLLLCGSFDPVTNAHLHLARIGLKYLQDVLGEPSAQVVFSPVHEAYPFKKLTPSAHRVAMLELAIEHSDLARSARVSRLEVDHAGGFQFTFLAVAQLRQALGGAQIYLCSGSDLVRSMCNPAIWPERNVRLLLESCTVLAFARNRGLGSAPLPELREAVRRLAYLQAALEAGRLVLVEADTPEASSSAVRAGVAHASAQDTSDMVPPAVLDYIGGHGLYTP